MINDFNSYLLDLTKASSFEEIEVMQSLWSNYGKISRYKLKGSAFQSVVVKQIRLECERNTSFDVF